MGALDKVLKRELTFLKQKKEIRFAVFVFPLFFLLLVLFTFNSGSYKNLPIAIVDLDHSKISREIIRQINTVKSCQVDYLLDNTLEGQKLMAGGKIYAQVVIPRHFESDLKRNKQPQIVYSYNNQMIATGGIVSKDLGTVLKNLLGQMSIQQKMKLKFSKKSAIASTNVIKIDERIKGNPYLNYTYFLNYVAIAHVFQVLVTLITIWSLGFEFKNGTLKNWFETANQKIFPAILGKVSLYFMIFWGYICFAYASFIVFFPAPFEGNVLFTCIGAGFYILAYMMMGVFFVAITSNLRKAISFGAIYTSLGFTFSGMTYPSMALTSFGDLYSRLLPIRPFLNLIINQALKGVPVRYDVHYLGWLSLYIVFGLCSFILLNKNIKDEKLCHMY